MRASALSNQLQALRQTYSSRAIPKAVRPLTSAKQPFVRGNVRALLEASAAKEEKSTARVELLGIHGGNVTVRGQLESCLPQKQVYALLTDYEECSNVFSNIATSRVLHTTPTVTIRQECHWKFLIFTGTFELDLTVDEQPDEGSLVFKLIRSGFMKDFEGRWHIKRISDNKCIVEHCLSIKPIFQPPDFLAFYTRSIFEEQVATIMADLQSALLKLEQTKQTL